MMRALALAGLLSAVVACRSTEADHRGAAPRRPPAAGDATGTPEAAAPRAGDDRPEPPDPADPLAEARGSDEAGDHAQGADPSGSGADATPAAPTDPLEPPPLPPALAAHLALVEQAQGFQIVAQIDARGIAGTAIFRLAAESALPASEGPAGGDASCLGELVGAVEAATYSVQRTGDGAWMGVALADVAADLPGIVACIRRASPDLPESVLTEAAGGWVELAPHIALASVGPRTVALGSDVLVHQARAGAVRPVADSPLFQRARTLAGPGTAYVVLLDPSGPPGSLPRLGGAALRIGPQVAVSGALVFDRIAAAGRAAARFSQILDALDAGRAASGEPPSGVSPGTPSDLDRVVDALIDASLVLRGPTLSFDARLPVDADFAGLLAEALRLLPSLAEP